MAFAEVSGFRVSSQVSDSRKPMELGRRSWHGRNTPTKYIRRRLRRFDLNTTLRDEDEARALRSLFSGQGWSIPFTSGFNGEKNAIKPQLGNGYRFSPAGGLNGGALKILSGDSVTYNFGLNIFEYSIFARVKHVDTTWHVYGFSDDGTHWLDGVPLGSGSPSAAINAWFSVSSGGNLTINGLNESQVAADLFVDELVVLPFDATTGMMEAWTLGTSLFSPLPFIKFSGTFISDGPRNFSVNVKDARYTQKPDDVAAHGFAFSIFEQKEE